MGGKSDAPPSPDFMSLAEKTGKEGRNLLAQQTYANRPGQVTPFGSTSWDVSKVYDPATKQYVPSWTQRTSLDPGLQKAAESQIALQRGRSKLAGGMLGRVATALGRPVDYGQFGDPTGLKYDPKALRNQATQIAYESATSRLDPKFAEAQNSLEIQLRGQGLRPGDQAYDSAIANFERSKTDAYRQAERDAFQLGQGEAQQLYGQQIGTADYANKVRTQRIVEMLQQRGVPLNEINALISGQQVGMPQMQDFVTAEQGTPTDYMGAGKAQYQSGLDAFNANQMQSQAFMNSLLGMGSIAGGFFH